MRSKPTRFRLALLGLAALSACQREPATPPPEPQAAATPPAPAAPPPALGRADLLAAIDAAAAAYAVGVDPAGPSLAGRRFAVRQAFGCAGPVAAPAGETPGDGLARWSWGRDQKTIELRLSPGDWKDTAPVAGGAPAWEAAEGFWLTRPWLRTDGCPTVKPDPTEMAGPASAQSAGLAAVFEEGGSRLGRRNGRAYAFTVRGEGGQPPGLPLGGYRVVLEGRLVAFADGAAIRCRADGPDQRPVCVAAAQLDRVAFEDPSGAVLSEWRAG